ncbi:MAG: ankyrin repeat domain-containing protein [Lachnospira sp.]|nr:ankyrin repeat domain-containing protein [Lachnospira sp.]
MGFMGIFLVALFVVIIVVGVSSIIGVTFIIVSIVMKCKYNKNIKNAGNNNLKKPKKTYLILRIIGCIFMVPLVGIIGLFVHSAISTAIEHKTLLAYSVTTGDYEQAEYLLKKGVNPDCTLESNKLAQNGEQTLLSLLCEKGGFIDALEDPVDDVVTEEELDMIRLLIKYGADLEAVDYIHEKNCEWHEYQEKADYYNRMEGCGYTPLLHAVEGGHYEIVKVLVESGADVEAKGYDGFNVVHIVAEILKDSDGEEMLQYLIDNGARADELTNYMQDAAFLAERHHLSYRDWDNDGIMKIIEQNSKKSFFEGKD